MYPISLLQMSVINKTAFENVMLACDDDINALEFYVQDELICLYKNSTHIWDDEDECWLLSPADAYLGKKNYL